MPYLNWISDQNLEHEVGKILETARVALTKAGIKHNRNVTDPFSVMWEVSGFRLASVAEWEVGEKARRAQKTLSTAFGTFHQNILGHVAGWTNLGTGNSADLECPLKKVIAEIKNKFTTTKGSYKVKVYDDLFELVMPISSKYHGYTSYYVETIPKPEKRKPISYDVDFTPSDAKTKTCRPANSLIRRVDGKSFYELVTGQSDALSRLYAILPLVIVAVGGTPIEPTDVTSMNDYFAKAIP